MLVRQVHAVQPGETILVQAAAGGVGRILSQWAAHLGAIVIGTAGGPAKCAIARAHGCAHVIDYRAGDFVAAVKEITGGAGVAVAYDSVGADTFDGSIECLGLRGHLVNFGQSSGPVPPFAIARLMAKSNTLTRPAVFHYAQPRPALEAMAAALWGVLGSGAVIVMNDTRCMVKSLLRLSYFYQHESCGQCTPCREGTGWLWRMVDRIEHGKGRPDDLALLDSVADNIKGRTICALGDAAAMPVQGMLKHFRDEFAHHIEHKSCLVPQSARIHA
jgi:hypothetical protein